MEAGVLVWFCSSPVGVLTLTLLTISRVLVAMDRQTSFALGRPCAIQDEE